VFGIVRSMPSDMQIDEIKMLIKFFVYDKLIFTNINDFERGLKFIPK